ncbi:BQ5605_C003g02292 [Microbotryum silenes-dioicae]|uniref:BQ5605_C003g02292 protein n=1 Tax=Microbotryum silenes-dioicae TaxID=796604 RepID=A0A2X0M5J3_9BASI|nr:BQ5605_C003g02292 [Microbotryum silenes-dioicae]
MTALQTRPPPPVHDQWKDAQRRGFCIWSLPTEATRSEKIIPSIGAGASEVGAAITTLARVGAGPPETGEAAAGSKLAVMSTGVVRGEVISSDLDDDFTSRIESVSLSTDRTTSPFSNPSGEASPRTRTTLSSLPTEILSHILKLAIQNTPSYQLARHLERYSLINRTFSTLAQANLFHRIVIEGRRGARAFEGAQEHLLDLVKAVVVLGEENGYWGMEELEGVLRRCEGLKELTLRNVRLDLGRFDLDRITSLELGRVTLENSSASSLPLLRDLTIQDVTYDSEQPFRTILPSLRSLRFNYEQATTSPLLFQHLIPCITSIESLEVERLYPATQFVDYLLSPSPSVKRAASPPLARTSSAEGPTAGTSSPSAMVEAEMIDASSSTPSLARLTHLKTLILWSDSSHRANSPFPLLETLLGVELEELVVRVDWGYRDRVQEIQAMENELCARIEEEGSKLGSLRRLILPKEFRGRVGRLGSVLDGFGVGLRFA